MFIARRQNCYEIGDTWWRTPDPLFRLIEKAKRPIYSYLTFANELSFLSSPFNSFFFFLVVYKLAPVSMDNSVKLCYKNSERKEEKLLSNRRSQEIEQYHMTTQQLTVSDNPFPWLFIVSESELGTHSLLKRAAFHSIARIAILRYPCVTCASIGARNDWRRQMSQLRCRSCN